MIMSTWRAGAHIAWFECFCLYTFSDMLTLQYAVEKKLNDN